MQKFFQPGGALADEPENGFRLFRRDKFDGIKGNLAEMMRIKRTMHDDDGRLARQRKLLAQWKHLRIVAVINRADFFVRIAASREPFGKFI